MKRSFNEQIKYEIIQQPINQNQFLIITSAFLYNNCGIIFDQQKYPNGAMAISHYQKSLLAYFQYYLQKYYQISGKLIISNKPKGINKLVFSNSVDYDFLNNQANQLPDYAKNKQHHRYILIGTFLAHGIVCDFTKGYHTEIRFKLLDHAQLMLKILKGLKIDAKLYTYQQRIRIYLKKSESISDLLKILNAMQSMLDLEEVVISNDFINQNQRFNNLDLANIVKTTKSAAEQIRMIQVLKQHHLISTLPDKIRKFITIRLDHPEATLNEIAHYFQIIYGIKITKSNLNHISRKIKAIYQNLY